MAAVGEVDTHLEAAWPRRLKGGFCMVHSGLCTTCESHVLLNLSARLIGMRSAKPGEIGGGRSGVVFFGCGVAVVEVMGVLPG